MAAGSSAPELFTALITVLITGGSEGQNYLVSFAEDLARLFPNQPSYIALEALHAQPPNA